MAGRVELQVTSHVDTPPYCLHGPTLLFRRYYQKDKPPRQFYACAVHRNRKGCPFFHDADQPISEEKREQYMELYRQHQQSLIDQQTIVSSLTTATNIGYCTDCDTLYDSTQCTAHSEHTHRRDTVTEKELKQPTRLLYPISDKKWQAQYFFSDKTQSFLIAELKRLAVSHVICLGVPRLYETLLATTEIKCYLLDIDHRYCQFYSPDVFQRYNMFNGFFYSTESGKESLKRFVKSTPKKENVFLIVDPPFGGLINALRTGIDVIWKLIETECATLLIFPYFNETHVLESFPNFVMLDYQVTYDNHRYYGDEGKRGRPSPVRIFTNLSLPALILPIEEGYQYCSLCNRYISSANKHCPECDSCTSKNGRSYKHCFQCGICVKQSLVHCTECKSCQVPKHSCRQDIQVKSGCYLCGAFDHKKRHCPSKPPLSRKRSKSFQKKPFKKGRPPEQQPQVSKSFNKKPSESPSEQSQLSGKRSKCFNKKPFKKRRVI